MEEASQVWGSFLWLLEVRDEVFLGATDTFAGKQGAGGDAAEDLENKILYEAGLCIPVVGGRLHFEEPTIIIVQ